MAQSRYFEFGADDTTLSLNASNVGISKGGVYAGFDGVQLFNAPTLPQHFNIQIRHTGSGVSYTNPQGVTKSPIGIIVTNQGGKIWEDAPINVAIPENTDAIYSIVVQHNYQAISGGIQAVYLAIELQTALSSDMVKIGELSVVQNGSTYDLTWKRERTPFINGVLNDPYFDTETKFANEADVTNVNFSIGKLEFKDNYVTIETGGVLSHIEKPKRWDFPNTSSVSASYFVKVNSLILIVNNSPTSIEGFAPISSVKFPRGGAPNMFSIGSVLEFVYFDGVWNLVNEFNPNIKNYTACEVEANSNTISNTELSDIIEVTVRWADAVIEYVSITNTILNKPIIFLFNTLRGKLKASYSPSQDGFYSLSRQDEYYDLRYPITAIPTEDGLIVVNGVKITPNGDFTSVSTWIGTTPTHNLKYRANGDYIEFEGKLTALKGNQYTFRLPNSLFEIAVNDTVVVGVRETVDKPNLGTGYEMSYITNGSFVDCVISGNDPTSTMPQINYNFNNLRIRRKA